MGTQSVWYYSNLSIMYPWAMELQWLLKEGVDVLLTFSRISLENRPTDCTCKMQSVQVLYHSHRLLV